MISQEERDGLLNSIRQGMQARNAMSKEKRNKQVRKAFADFIVGNISEHEARSLGIVAGNGSVTVPEVIASEVITYAQKIYYVNTVQLFELAVMLNIRSW